MIFEWCVTKWKKTHTYNQQAPTNLTLDFLKQDSFWFPFSLARPAFAPNRPFTFRKQERKIIDPTAASDLVGGGASEGGVCNKASQSFDNNCAAAAANNQQEHQQLQFFYALIFSVFFLLRLVDLGIGFLSGTRVERIEEQQRRVEGGVSTSSTTRESALFRPQ